jgi:hypothetical protein
MKKLKGTDLSYLPPHIAVIVRDLLPEDADCSVADAIAAIIIADNTKTGKSTRSAVCDEPEDTNYKYIKPYITSDGKRHPFVPKPEEYVQDAEDSYLETYHVVTVYKVGENDLLIPVARHDFGSKEPTKTQIKWCILRYKGDTATVTQEYGLGF